MNYKKLIDTIVANGIKAAKRDYKRKNQKAILKGSIAGFKACLGKGILELAMLLKEAKEKTTKARGKKLDKYWEARGFELEVEWVCNVVSAALMNEKKPTIITPTARGVISAADIVGVADKVGK